MNREKVPESSVDQEKNDAAIDKARSKKADPVKRIIAFIIDAAISMIFGLIPLAGGIIGALYMLFRDALPIEAIEYKSVGKKLLKLSLVNTKDYSENIDYASSAKRNWMFALGPVMYVLIFIPIIGWILDLLIGLVMLILVIAEIVKIFTDEKGQRFGDKMADTMVIEA